MSASGSELSRGVECVAEERRGVVEALVAGMMTNPQLWIVPVLMTAREEGDVM